jgi:HEAT repeat protein
MGLVGAVLAGPPATTARKEIVDALKSDRPAQREAAATLLGELSADNLDAKEKGRFATVVPAEFVADLAQMADKDPDARVREAAATALGRMQPDLDTALAPLANTLTNKDKKHIVEERRAAADALASLVRRARPYERVQGKIEKAAENELVVKANDKNRQFTVTPETWITLDEKPAKMEDLANEMAVRVFAQHRKDTAAAGRIQASTSVDSSYSFSTSSDKLLELVGIGQEIIPLAAVALRDSDSQVRRFGADALLQLAIELTFQLKLPRSRNELALLRPLYRAFRAQTPTLVEGVNDSDLSVRMLVRQTLEELAAVYPLLPRPEPSPADKAGLLEEQEPRSHLRASIHADEPPGDSVFSAVAPIVKALEKGISDTDVDGRIAAIEVLEMLRENAVPATPTLVQALRDPDLFVRWSAARALGKIETSRRQAKMAPAAGAKGAVDGLIRLLVDADLDVQIAAAEALERYGADAGKAADPLANAAASGDPSFRLAAIHALGEIGEPARSKSVAAQLAKAVKFPEDPRVRADAARLLGRLGSAAQDTIGVLRAALKDPDPSVRRAAADALLSIPGSNRK